MIDKTRKVDDVNKDSAHLMKCNWCNTTILSTDNFYGNFEQEKWCNSLSTKDMSFPEKFTS